MARRGRVLNLGLGAVAAGAVALGVAAIGPPSAPKAQPRLVAVSKGLVQTTVSATGNIQAPTSLAVNFKSGGVLTAVNVSPGDHVTKGQPLATIDATDLQATLTNAQANLTSAQARLLQTTQGLTPQEQAQNQISADQAQAAVDQASQSLQDTQRLLALNANGYQTTIDQARNQLARDQAVLANDQAQQGADQSQLDADQSQLSRDQVASPVNQQAVSSDQTKVNQDQTKVQSDQSKVNGDNNTIAKDNDSVQNALNAQVVGLARDQQTLDSSQNSFNNALRSQQATLAANAVKTEPVKPGDLAGAQSSVTTAQVAVDNAQRAVDAATLTAPIDGTVAAVNGKVGETVGSSGGSSSSSSSTGAAGGGGASGTASSSSSGFITLTDLTNLVVKAGFSETDAAKVQLNQPATISLDALPNATFSGHVAAIDTTSTVVSNVVTYNVTVALDRTSPQIKPGMTATAVVVVNQRQGVLNAPSAAVQGTGQNGTVTVMINGKEVREPVVVGLRGDETTEIVSGIDAGTRIVVSQGSALVGSTSGRTGTGGATRTGGGPGGIGGGGIGGGAGGGGPRGGG